MKLKSDTTSMSTSHSTSASPCKDPTNNSNVSTLIKQTGSTPQLLFQGSFEPLDFGFRPIKPMWIPHTKVFLSDEEHLQTAHHPNRHTMTISENG